MVSDVKYQNFLKFFEIYKFEFFFFFLEVTNKTEVTTPDTPIAGTSARRGCKTGSPSKSRSRSPHTRSRSRSRSPLRSVTEEPPDPEDESAV